MRIIREPLIDGDGNPLGVLRTCNRGRERNHERCHSDPAKVHERKLNASGWI
jgi:hypothetical protein